MSHERDVSTAPILPAGDPGKYLRFHLRLADGRVMLRVAGHRAATDTVPGDPGPDNDPPTTTASEPR